MIRQLIFTALLIVLSGRVGASPADEYYREHLSHDMADASDLPSECYYKENMLRGGPPSGPGGEEENGNTPVGVPVGEACVPGMGLMVAGAFIYRRNRQERRRNKQQKTNTKTNTNT